MDGFGNRHCSTDQTTTIAAINAARIWPNDYQIRLQFTNGIHMGHCAHTINSIHNQFLSSNKHDVSNCNVNNLIIIQYRFIVQLIREDFIWNKTWIILFSNLSISCKAGIGPHINATTDCTVCSQITSLPLAFPGIYTTRIKNILRLNDNIINFIEEHAK